DCIMIWTGGEAKLMEFCSFLNSNNLNVKFTYQYSAARIEFLDVELFICDDKIHSRLFRKATACNSILHAESAHPRHQVASIPYGEFLRARRNCSIDAEFVTQL
ncbi:hypothetical protein NDU88_000767, partial [Pleurodeles waltl]